MNVRFNTDALDKVACDVLVVGAGPELGGAIAQLDASFGGRLLPQLHARRFRGAKAAVVTIPSMGAIAARELVVVGTGDGSAASLKVAASRAGREARTLRAESVALAFGADTGPAILGLIEAASAGSYKWEAYKPEDDRSPNIEIWIGPGIDDAAVPSAAVREAKVRARWQSWGRDLVNAPAADLYPESLAAKAREIEALPNVEMEVWDFERCKREGLVGIVAVGQGSDRPGCMIHVRYRPDNARHHVALVGKGVTFDSGGLSLKPSGSMQTMRCDMGGSATMLAATGAIAELGIPVAVDCIVGAVENMVAGNSYKLGDILRYSNGVTVEIHNTDAEGRLVLADCLIHACGIPGVQTVLDAATLTGACVVAVGTDFTGVFTKDDALAAELAAAGEAAGEGVWRLPLHDPYKEMLKSDYAQIKNVGGRDAGASTAALFLQYFVETDKVRWAHLDIAGSAFVDKVKPRYAAGATGEMVRTLVGWAATLGD